MPRLSRLLVHPVKSLDPLALDAATVRESGGLSHDREYAIVDSDGDYVNGKREPAVHRIASDFDPETGALTVGPRDASERETFRLPGERAAAADWLSAFFGYEVHLKRDDTGGFPDDTQLSGPTVVAAATLEAVAGWFDGVDAAETCRRLRPNLVVSGVEPFWEDRLYAGAGAVVPFSVGGARFEGVNPCQRCAVPTRDPDTGEETPGFRERFVERREATLPDWAARDRFDHYFRLMVNTRVPEATVGERVETGDELTIGKAVEA